MCRVSTGPDCTDPAESVAHFHRSAIRSAQHGGRRSSSAGATTCCSTVGSTRCATHRPTRSLSECATEAGADMPGGGRGEGGGGGQRGGGSPASRQELSRLRSRGRRRSRIGARGGAGARGASGHRPPDRSARGRRGTGWLPPGRLGRGGRASTGTGGRRQVRHPPGAGLERGEHERRVGGRALVSVERRLLVGLVIEPDRRVDGPPASAAAAPDAGRERDAAGSRLEGAVGLPARRRHRQARATGARRPPSPPAAARPLRRPIPSHQPRSNRSAGAPRGTSLHGAGGTKLGGRGARAARPDAPLALVGRPRLTCERARFSPAARGPAVRSHPTSCPKVERLVPGQAPIITSALGAVRWRRKQSIGWGRAPR